MIVKGGQRSRKKMFLSCEQGKIWWKAAFRVHPKREKEGEIFQVVYMQDELLVVLQIKDWNRLEKC